MSNQFNTFNSANAPTIADHIVGYGDIGGTDWEKRWLINDLVTLFQSVLDITTIAVGADNYLRVTGSAAGAGTVTLRPDGTDANQDLILEGLGTGEVIINGNLQFNANLDTGGYNIATSGGELSMGGGNINTNNGDILLGSGALSTSGVIACSGSINVSAGGTLTLSNTGELNCNGALLKVDSIVTSLAADISIGSSLIVGVGAANQDITTSGIIGNKDHGLPGNDPIDLLLTGVVEISSQLFTRGKAFFTFDVITKTYLRGSITRGLIANPGATQGLGLIYTEFNQYGTVASLGDCATLPLLAAEGYSLDPYLPYMHIIVRNDGGAAMDVYPNVGGRIDGGALNAPVAVAAGAFQHFYGVDNSGTNEWFTA